MKRALLVFPSYIITGADPSLVRILELSGVVPQRLEGYNVSGCRVDELKIKLSFWLSAEYEFKTLSGEVIASDFVNRLQWLLEPNVSVALLVFCGHGMNDKSSHHSSLVCSYNQKITGGDIDDVLLKSHYSGTFIQIINTCYASPNIAALNSSQPLDGDAFRQAYVHSHFSKRIQIFASSPHGETFGSEKGSLFIDELYRSMCRNGGPFRYEDIPNILHNSHAQVRTSCPLAGVFGEAATLLPVRHAENRFHECWKHLAGNRLQVTPEHALLRRGPTPSVTNVGPPPPPVTAGA